jgi:hypothetical protein
MLRQGRSHLEPSCAEIAPNFNDFSPTIRVKRAFENGLAPDGTVRRRRPDPRQKWERFMWRDFSKALRELWRISGEGAGSYRPDLHYMRGPGPKWHAKYGSLVTQTQPTAVSAGPALREVAEHRA